MPEHLERHPFGKVPVLDHDGMRILETTAIARYLNDVLPGKSLVPPTPKDRARMDMIIGMIDSYGYGALLGGVVAYHLFPDFVGGKNDAMRKSGLENGRKMIDFAMTTRRAPFHRRRAEPRRSLSRADRLLRLADPRQGNDFRYRWLCGLVDKDASLAELRRHTTKTRLTSGAFANALAGQTSDIRVCLPWAVQSNGGSSTCSATSISRAAIYAARALHSTSAAEASLLVDLPRDEMALLIELGVHLCMN